MRGIPFATLIARRQQFLVIVLYVYNQNIHTSQDYLRPPFPRPCPFPPPCPFPFPRPCAHTSHDTGHISAPWTQADMQFAANGTVFSFTPSTCDWRTIKSEVGAPSSTGND
jgi:hypothetical protein